MINKSVDEIRLLLQITEDLYRKGDHFSKSGKNIMLEQSVEYLNANNNEKALFIMNQAIMVDPELTGIDYGRAIVFARIGKKNEARELLTKVLENRPDHENAKILFEALKQEN
jgi:Tfp pilus assembly protein PilF